MGKMVQSVQNNRKKVTAKTVTNFMGGTSYKLNALDNLKIIAASSIFGEPSYYRNGEFGEASSRKIVDGTYRVNSLVSKHSILDTSFEGLKTSDIMEKAIDSALEYDFEGTLDFAISLRKDYFMRLNPQIIMVRASIHPNREEFTKKNPGKFADINMKVMSRADEPSSQLTYWLFRNGSKSGIPSVLKRSWAKRIEALTRYQMAKYKNTGIGIIDTVRVSHAKSPLVDELMKTGTIEVTESKDLTWEKLKSEGKSWKEILDVIEMNHMAALRNLRGIFSEINDSSVASKFLEQLKAGVKNGKQFPFRYFTAYQVIERESNINHKPQILDALEECIDLSRDNMPKLKGKTISLSDNSGSAWGGFTSEYGSVTVAEIDNLSSILTGQNSDEGYIGIFGDQLEVIPVSKRNGALTQTKAASRIGNNIGMGTENGIWLFFDKAIKNKEHWDNIFIYSDQQASHGGLYGTAEEARRYVAQGYGIGKGGYHVDVMKLIEAYRREVNPKVNVFSVQTSGYDNVLLGESIYRGAVLTGWTGKEVVYADAIIKFWDEKEAQKSSNKL